jgi:demethylmenaquinone methyltransferase / 2-methoxy-6-polyprenyl-1,4-benzoquinol methylase
MARDRISNDSTGLSPQTWRQVIRAIEESIPLYDKVNDAISFGKAQTARKFAIQKLQLADGLTILDSGIGPGTASKLIMQSVKPGLLLGFDGSAKQLKTAKSNLVSFGQTTIQFVRGSFEFLPFRDSMFDAIITCYALRDSLNLLQSIGEYERVCAKSGTFADVDLGKADNIIKRAGSTFYIRYLMPLIAKAAIVGKIKGNPWRMIVPTYKPLPTNRSLRSQMGNRFHNVELKEFLMGGIIVIIGRKSSP